MTFIGLLSLFSSLGPVGIKAIFIAGKVSYMDSLDQKEKQTQNEPGVVSGMDSSLQERQQSNMSVDGDAVKLEPASSRKNSQKAVSKLVISSMMLALAVVLEFVTRSIPFFKSTWLMGGSISITMVPLILTALYCGPVYGTVISIAYAVINFFIDGVIGWTPNTLAVCLSLLLDYVVGFGCCGLAAIFRKPFFRKEGWVPIASVLLCGTVRLFASFLSGIIVFTQAFDYDSTSGLSTAFTPEGCIYSITYNAGYMIPSMVLCAVLFVVLLSVIYSTFNTPLVRPLIPDGISEENTERTLPSKFVMPLYLIIDYVFALLSMIPQAKMYYLGYFSLIISFVSAAYFLIYRIAIKKEKTSLNFLYFILFLFGLAMSICGICSFLTYGSNFYPTEE